MASGNSNSIPNAMHTIQIHQALPTVEVNSHNNTLSETGCTTITDEVMARRLKNRERQRRYRARKRLEEDMKRSCLIQQQAFLATQPQINRFNPYFGQCGISSESESESQSEGSTTGFGASVYCGRKWKKDARRVHLLEEQRNPPIAVKPPIEPELHLLKEQEIQTADSSIVVRPLKKTESKAERTANPGGRRQWKAEARNKMTTGNLGSDLIG